MSQAAALPPPAESTLPSGTPDPSLHGRWLLIARATWMVLASFALVFFVANLPRYFTDLHTICAPATCVDKQLTFATAPALEGVGISLGVYAAVVFALTFCSAAIWLAVGGMLA